MGQRTIWKWLTVLVAGSWVLGLAFEALGMVPIAWVAGMTLPGVIAGSFAPALWFSKSSRKRRRRRKAVL